MSVNTIEIGSGIPDTIENDMNAEEYFDFSRPQKILIVEGNTDKQALENYFSINKINFDFEIKTSEIEESKSGKKIALEYYSKNKETQDIRLLIDRDYDFLCSSNCFNSDIFYYDYYELENYIFEENVIRLVLISHKVRIDKVEEIVNFLMSSISDLLDPLITCSKLRIFRELHKNYKTTFQLSTEAIHKYAYFVKHLNIIGCLIGKDPKIAGDTFKDRIEKYLKYELKSIDRDLYDKINNQFESLAINYPNSLFEFFRYFFKGKDCIKFFPILLKEANIFDGNLNEFSSSKLLNNYIYTSKLYKKRLMKFVIHSEFDNIINMIYPS